MSPWSEIIGLRNILVHNYFDVDIERIWQTVQNDLPQLRRIATRLRAED